MQNNQIIDNQQRQIYQGLQVPESQIEEQLLLDQINSNIIQQRPQPLQRQEQQQDDVFDLIPFRRQYLDTFKGYDVNIDDDQFKMKIVKIDKQTIEEIEQKRDFILKSYAKDKYNKSENAVQQYLNKLLVMTIIDDKIDIHLFFSHYWGVQFKQRKTLSIFHSRNDNILFSQIWNKQIDLLLLGLWQKTHDVPRIANHLLNYINIDIDHWMQKVRNILSPPVVIHKKRNLDLVDELLDKILNFIFDNSPQNVFYHEQLFILQYLNTKYKDLTKLITNSDQYWQTPPTLNYVNDMAERIYEVLNKSRELQQIIQTLNYFDTKFPIIPFGVFKDTLIINPNDVYLLVAFILQKMIIISDKTHIANKKALQNTIPNIPESQLFFDIQSIQQQIDKQQNSLNKTQEKIQKSDEVITKLQNELDTITNIITSKQSIIIPPLTTQSEQSNLFMSFPEMDIDDPEKIIQIHTNILNGAKISKIESSYFKKIEAPQTLQNIKSQIYDIINKNPITQSQIKDFQTDVSDQNLANKINSDTSKEEVFYDIHVWSIWKAVQQQVYQLQTKQEYLKQLQKERIGDRKQEDEDRYKQIIDIQRNYDLLNNLISNNTLVKPNNQENIQYPLFVAVGDHFNVDMQLNILQTVKLSNNDILKIQFVVVLESLDKYKDDHVVFFRTTKVLQSLDKYNFISIGPIKTYMQQIFEGQGTYKEVDKHLVSQIDIKEIKEQFDDQINKISNNQQDLDDKYKFICHNTDQYREIQQVQTYLDEQQSVFIIKHSDRIQNIVTVPQIMTIKIMPNNMGEMIERIEDFLDNIKQQYEIIIGRHEEVIPKEKDYEFLLSFNYVINIYKNTKQLWIHKDINKRYGLCKKIKIENALWALYMILFKQDESLNH